MSPEVASSKFWWKLLSTLFFKKKLVVLGRTLCLSGMLHSLLMFNKNHHKNTIITGKSFLKSFHWIGGLRALTRARDDSASALPATERDVMSLLGLISPIFVRRPLNRTNIFYVVRVQAQILNKFPKQWYSAVERKLATISKKSGQVSFLCQYVSCQLNRRNKTCCLWWFYFSLISVALFGWHYCLWHGK